MVRAKNGDAAATLEKLTRARSPRTPTIGSAPVGEEEFEVRAVHDAMTVEVGGIPECPIRA